MAIAQMQGTIDQLIEQGGIPCTLLRPNGFMQNWVNFSAAQTKAGTYAAPNGDGAISVIDVPDIAEVAAIVLTHPAAHVGKAYTLTVAVLVCKYAAALATEPCSATAT